jgi:hypothetical protein
MAEGLSDLVHDTRLETKVVGDRTIHTKYISNPITGQRRQRLEETWERIEELGRGSFGVVWLERCISGPRSGTVWAVKELQKDQASKSVCNYSRELEAIAKFSQARVRFVNSLLNVVRLTC